MTTETMADLFGDATPVKDSNRIPHQNGIKKKVSYETSKEEEPEVEFTGPDNVAPCYSVNPFYRRVGQPCDMDAHNRRREMRGK